MKGLLISLFSSLFLFSSLNGEEKVLLFDQQEEVPLFSEVDSKADGNRKESERQNDMMRFFSFSIAEGIKSAFVEVVGKYSLFDSYEGKKISDRYFGKSFLVEASEEGLSWGELFVSIYQIEIVPGEESKILVDGIQYPGSLLIYAVEDRLFIINKVEEQEALFHLLSAQVSRENVYDLVTLRTLAIVTRTDLAYRRSLRGKKLWDAKKEEFPFLGVVGYSEGSLLKRAIDETKGNILQEEGRSFPCKWHEHSAGRTADYTAIFHREPPPPISLLGGKFPEAQQDRERVAWNFSFPSHILAESVGLDDIEGISLYADLSSSRVYALKLSYENEGRILSFEKFYQLLFPQLKSNWFEVRLEKRQISVSGWGMGLGVGLCLYTAEQNSLIGKDEREILQLFFPRAEIVKM